MMRDPTVLPASLRSRRPASTAWAMAACTALAFLLGGCDKVPNPKASSDTAPAAVEPGGSSASAAR